MADALTSLDEGGLIGSFSGDINSFYFHRFLLQLPIDRLFDRCCCIVANFVFLIHQF